MTETLVAILLFAASVTVVLGKSSSIEPDARFLQFCGHGQAAKGKGAQTASDYLECNTIYPRMT